MTGDEDAGRRGVLAYRRQLLAGVRELTARAGAAAWPVARRAAPVAAAVTPLGWSVLAGSAGTWAAGWWFGWVELTLAATAGLVLSALCALLTAGRTRLRVAVTL